MNYANHFLYYGAPFKLPTASHDEIKERVKNSDFVVMDDAGAHRMVGLKYDLSVMMAPQVTFVFMRHKVAAAKRAAFDLGKKIYYDSKLSARLFGCQVGDEIPLNEFNSCAKLYSDFIFLKEKPKSPLLVDRWGHIVINGQTLPRFFKVRDVAAILGKPDRSWIFEGGARLWENEWRDWGLRLYSYNGQAGAVFQIQIFLNQAIVNIGISRRWINDGKGNYFSFKHKRQGDFISINSWCEQDSVSFRFEEFNSFYIALVKGDYSALEKLLKSGADINKPNKFYKETPLNFAVCAERTDCVKFLLQHGADKTKCDVWGKTPLENAKRLGYDEIVRLLE